MATETIEVPDGKKAFVYYVDTTLEAATIECFASSQPASETLTDAERARVTITGMLNNYRLRYEQRKAKDAVEKADAIS